MLLTTLLGFGCAVSLSIVILGALLALFLLFDSLVVEVFML